MIVFIAGMRRSGSTFSFNVVRELLSRRGTTYQEASASLLSTIERSGDADHVLCKGHGADETTFRLIALGAVKIVCTVRRPEDAVASAMECFRHDLDRAVADVREWLVMFERIRDRSLIVCYEEIDTRPWDAALRIARYICPDWTTEEIDRIVKMYSKEHVIKISNKLRIDDIGVIHLPYSFYDGDTFFHRRHVSSLTSWPAAKRIGQDAVSYIRHELASYIDERGNLHSVHNELQREIRAALSLITPMKVLNRKKIRVGGNHDGGYVMIDDLDGGGICYSLGVGPDISWDLDMAQRGWEVHQYDHTVDDPSPQHPNCHFRQIGIAPNDFTPKMKRLDTLVQQNGHTGRTDMILKMDIEGGEWECLDCLKDYFLGQFRQILIEIHWVDHLIAAEFRSLFTRVMEKIRQTHECVHIHANNFSRIIDVWGLPVTEVYELTFVRREDYRFTENDERFPSDLDFPNNEAMPDYDLGLFKFPDPANTVAETPEKDAEPTFYRRTDNFGPARDPIKLLEFIYIEPDGIIHVGANTGQEAVRYAKSCPDICVYVEPIGSVFERLQANVSRYPGHIAVQGLCSDVDGELVEFNIANNGGASSSLFPLGEHARLYPEITYTNTETYRTTTLDSLITSRFPDARFNLLVVDTQGSELKVLKGATALLRKVDGIFVKICPYPLYDGGCTYLEIDEFLRPFGFLVNWLHFYRGEWGHAFFVRKVLTFYDKSENLALGRPARLSSDYMGWGAEGGNNGMLTGKFGFHTQLEDSPWWDVDLGDIRRLREIRVFNRTDAYPDRARHLVVQISNDGETWNEVHAQRGRIFGGLWGRPLQVPLSGQTARFVRTTLANKNYLHLDEIEVY